MHIPKTIGFLFAAICLATPHFLNAAVPTGKITIEQNSPSNALGEWTLIKPGNKRLTLSKSFHDLHEAELGVYTLLITPPSGASTKVQMFLENDLLDTYNSPQANFTLEEGMHVRLRIDYTFTRVGKVTVTSQPPGLKFTLEGPNDIRVRERTPHNLDEMPEGLYSVEFARLDDCPTPKPQSDRLEKDGRISFSITFNCEGVKNMDQQQDYESTMEFVNTVIDGKSVTFQDVPTREWFAPYVAKALKANVMSGYRNRAGKPTGNFGPGDNVNLAQLAKIAHEIANIDESKAYGRSKNTRARGTWFEDYFVSAEKLHWQVFTDARLDPGRPATRAEVVTTLLQALRVPRQWAEGNLFDDVALSTTYASSIETGALDGLVGGYEDGNFKPRDLINRAEMAKVLSSAIELYIDDEQ